MTLLVMQCNDVIKSGVMKVFSHQNIRFHRKKEYTHSHSIYIHFHDILPPFPCHVPMTYTTIGHQFF